MNVTRHLELRKRLTGKHTGSAHRYRVNRPPKQYGTHLQRWMGYLEEWVQEDGSSKYFIVDYTWEVSTGWLAGVKYIENVLEFSSLEGAMGEWRRDELRRARSELRQARTQALGVEKERQRKEIKKALEERVVAPITQGVASEEVQKPLPKVEECRWCKGDPRGLLMLNKYVPCTECSPLVTQVHDEIVCEVPKKGSSYEQMEGSVSGDVGFGDSYDRREAAHYGLRPTDMSWVKDELYIPVPDTALYQKMIEQGPTKKAVKEVMDHAREKGYELRGYVSADEAREEQKRRGVQEFDAKRASEIVMHWHLPSSEAEKKQMQDRVVRIIKNREEQLATGRDGKTQLPGMKKVAEKFEAEKGKRHAVKILPDTHSQEAKSFYGELREFLKRPVADLEMSKTYEKLCQMLRPGVEPEKGEKPMSYGIPPEVEKVLARDWELRQQQMAVTTTMMRAKGITIDEEKLRELGDLLKDD